MALASSVTAAIIAGAASGGSAVYGARRAGQSADRAARYTADADRRAEEIERRREEEDRRRWEAQQDFERRRFEATEEDRIYRRGLEEARERRAEPYRQASAAALAKMSDLIGLNGRRAPQRWSSPSQFGRGGAMGDLARGGRY